MYEYLKVMERLLNQYDKEYMKMAMLKHEETFREQVKININLIPTLYFLFFFLIKLI